MQSKIMPCVRESLPRINAGMHRIDITVSITGISTTSEAL